MRGNTYVKIAVVGKFETYIGPLMVYRLTYNLQGSRLVNVQTSMWKTITQEKSTIYQTVIVWYVYTENNH